MNVNLVEVERTNKEVALDKIYEQLKDKNVRTITFYGDSSNGLYLDSAKKVAATEVLITDAFSKGMMLINDGTNVLLPVAMTGSTVKTVGSSGLESWTVPTA